MNTTASTDVYRTDIQTSKGFNLKEMMSSYRCPHCPTPEKGEQVSYVMSGGFLHIKGCPKIKK